MKLFLYGCSQGNVYAIDNICKRNKLSFAVTSCPSRWQDAARMIERERPECVMLFFSAGNPDTFTLMETLRQQTPQPLMVVQCPEENKDFRHKADRLGSFATVTQITEDSMCMLIGAVERQIGKQDSPTRSTAPEYTATQAVPRMMDYLRQNYSAQLSNTLLSERFGHPAPSLCKAFKQATGATPREYVERRRIEKAKEILAHDPSLSIKAVSAMVGYSDPLYFSKVFRKHESVSPAGYVREGVAERSGADG